MHVRLMLSYGGSQVNNIHLTKPSLTLENLKKVKQHLDYIENEKSYLNQMDQEDFSDKEKNDINDRINHLDNRKEKYEDLLDQLDSSDQTQISTSDPDARALPKRMKIVEVAYNVQTACNDHHNLISNFEVTNKKDDYALAPMAIEAKRVLGLSDDDWMTALADKGYCNGTQLNTCHQNNIETLVAQPKPSNHQKHPDYTKEKFQYDIHSNTYICPAKQHLTTTGKLYKKDKNKRYRFRRYSLPFRICDACPHKLDCVGGKLKYRHGRSIDRSEFEYAVEYNKQNIRTNKKAYKRRQAIVEHPFGTIKRQWGYDYTLLKGFKKITGEFALIFSSYNLRRAMSILGASEFILAIREATFIILGMYAFTERGDRKFNYGTLTYHGGSGACSPICR